MNVESKNTLVLHEDHASLNQYEGSEMKEKRKAKDDQEIELISLDSSPTNLAKHYWTARYERELAQLKNKQKSRGGTVRENTGDMHYMNEI